MTSVLFVVNAFSTGGTYSSLKSILLSELQNSFKFHVFSLTNGGDYQTDIQNYNIGHNLWTSYARIDLKKISGWKKFLTYIVRLLIKLFSFFHIDLTAIIDKYTIRSIEQEYQFDYIVAFSEGKPTKFVSLFHNPHKIAWIHCDYSRCLRKKTKEFIIYNTFEKIVCVSRFTQKSYISIFPQFSSKTLCIYNLLDEKNILRMAIERIDNPKFIKKGFTIISVGRICEVKRYRLIPEIAKKIKDADINFRWYVIGPCAEPEEYEQTIHNIALFDVGNEVTLLGGIPNPYPYFMQSDLLVSLSWSEACPMIFNEAKVLKVPIITTDFGSSFEFIQNNYDGIIAPLEDISSKIIEIFNNQIKYKQIQRNIHFDSYNDRIIDNIKNLFTDSK